VIRRLEAAYLALAIARVFTLSMRCISIAFALAVSLWVVPAAAEVKLGSNASLGGKRVFPDDSPWNVNVSGMQVDPQSDAYVKSIGADAPLHPDFGASYNGGPFGMPYVVVAGGTPRTAVSFEYSDESDHAYYPIPPNPPLERGEDRHLIILDRDNWKLYELYALEKKGDLWHAGAGAVWDLSRNESRPAGWTSADAAGLPIFPGLVRYDEVVEQKEIKHALRFSAHKTRRAYVWPATHWASPETGAHIPPMGARFRLKASFDITTYPPNAQVILKALKAYGMILADNGGNWFVSGAADPRWNDDEIDTLKKLRGRDFEVVYTGNIVTP
jgi:hypothetical protein